MLRAAMVMCMMGVASASFLDGLIKHKKAEDSHPVLKMCHQNFDLFKVNGNTGLTVSPYPPRTGHSFTVSLRGDVQQDLQDIKMTVNVHYGFVHLITTTVDLCGELHCPIHKGAFTLDKEVKLPSAAPSGHYTISIKGENENKQEVICASLKVKID